MVRETPQFSPEREWKTPANRERDEVGEVEKVTNWKHDLFVDFSGIQQVAEELAEYPEDVDALKPMSSFAEYVRGANHANWDAEQLISDADPVFVDQYNALVEEYNERLPGITENPDSEAIAFLLDIAKRAHDLTRS